MKKLSVILFFAVAAVQLAVPVTMIMRKEKVISDGKMFRFKTAPIDPSDPFRGKYIILNLEASDYKLSKEESEMDLDGAYAHIRENKEGYAEVADISETPPEDTADYVKIKSDNNSFFGSWFFSGASFHFPFERFYMDEEKAPAAEALYRRTQRDTAAISYALVSILNGGGVVTDVIINGKSVREIPVLKLNDN